MNKCAKTVWGLALALLLTTVARPSLAEDTSYRVLLEWEGLEETSVGSGLFFYTDDAGGQTNTILIRTPTGQRFVGTERLDAIKGTDTFRIQDDTSRWWVETSIEWPRRWASMSAFFDQGSVDLEEAIENGEEMRILLRTPKGPVVDSSFPLMIPGEDFEALGRHLEGRSEGGLEEEMPADLVEALPFLEAALNTTSSMGSKFGPFVRFLRRQSGQPDSVVPDRSWSESREIKPGLNVTEADSVRLLESFDAQTQEQILRR